MVYFKFTIDKNATNELCIMESFFAVKCEHGMYIRHGIPEYPFNTIPSTSYLVSTHLDLILSTFETNFNHS